LLLGHCHSELRHDSAAVASYSACVALRANASEIYSRRGVAYFNQRDYHAALADLDLTLQFVPSHREARVFRAQTYLQLGKAREGLPDLDYVLGRPNPPVKTYFMRARLLAVCGEKDRAYADEIEGMKHAPTDEASWVERGVARRSVNHEGALEDFRQAEALNPRSFPALHNQAHVLNEYLHQPDEAIKVLDRVLTIYPDNAISLADRAQLLARQNRSVEALRDVKRVEELDRRPSMLYQMAGVYSLLSKADATHQKAALRLLAQAFRGGFGLDQIDNDHDFDPIRETTEFGTIRAAAKTLAVAGAE
jgi:tetratricopeptide (TPR) repeat protein